MIAEILTALYLVAALLLAVYASGVLLLLISYGRHRHQQPALPPVSEWPSVVVQLPVYNERYVVKRLLDAVASLDYPPDRLHIQLLDDSTDDTSAIAAAHIATLRRDGLQVDHIRRPDRAGYKAGALAHGLARTSCDLAAVFDADFVPPPDFLRRTVPYFSADPGLGMVQTRWSHLNRSDNWLTRGQALALDGHFVVEQTARSRAGWLINFNGSAGVWRVSCIEAAGGWRDTTLTEDLDLSYRAQLAGWRFLYLPAVVVPAELPPQMAAYKQQQARWAGGSTRTLLLMAGPLWRARLTLGQRIMATLHLCQYLPHPLMLLLLLLTPPLIVAHGLHGLPLGPLGVLGLAPPLIYATSQHALYPDWRRRLLAFPLLLALGTGISWNNTRAVIGALLPRARPAEFRRTPKFAARWSGSAYVLRADASTLVEILLALYALAGALLALSRQPALAPWLALYAYAFGLTAAFSLQDQWLIHRSAQRPRRTPVLQ
jgi:cellulose synthase/poly-beta-1,6-N-acetylglucosamine synthase-like glycosyltransferase